MSGSLSKERKAAILAEEDCCCHYCSEQADTIDHKIASVEGGSNGRENLVAACFPCNQAKGALPYDLFVRYMARFGRPDGQRWYRATNFFLDRAMINIAGRVPLFKMAEIVLDKFADGDADEAVRLMRRGLFRMGAVVDDDDLDALFDRADSPAVAPMYG